jgi:ribulose bisphosphate carboxylase small subunit
MLRFTKILKYITTNTFIKKSYTLKNNNNIDENIFEDFAKKSKKTGYYYHLNNLHIRNDDGYICEMDICFKCNHLSKYIKLIEYDIHNKKQMRQLIKEEIDKLSSTCNIYKNNDKVKQSIKHRMNIDLDIDIDIDDYKIRKTDYKWYDNTKIKWYENSFNIFYILLFYWIYTLLILIFVYP